MGVCKCKCRVPAIMSENIDMEKRDLESPAADHVLAKDEIINADSKYERVEIDHVAEKKLMRKIDLNLISLFGVGFAADLVNFSNTRAGTLPHELFRYE